ncbi:dimethylarginine dimethylaminohydrolase family protein [Nocardioides mangrovi]|uniref:Amidinotransferase n=1 Tax=Nocardioides mangrovi TaxID=2874580 RepID=A0ABS7UAI1_9ACTN|nr:arginine deiminase family protein [Nocardioides mangrovi]MBZ5738008.1 amidinotransferase [Nocardioides mangrovi]
MELSWGRRYVAVEPTHFRVEYVINPFMDPDDQPDPALAMAQWRELVATIERHGGTVEALPQREDAPDMVYAMNLGLGLVREDGQSHVVMSHMRYAERRMETSSAQPWFAERGFTTSYVGRDGVGAHLEAGDAFAFGDALVVGYGPRTEELALKHLATELGIRVRGLRITHPGMYHLDLAFCPLDDRRALVCPAALDEASAAALLELVPEPIVLTEEEALTTFCANSIVLGSTVIMPACPDRVRAQLEEWGFTVVVVDVSEFHKGGGSIRCLTNPVDVEIGRDLAVVPGGEVVLPQV